MLRAHNRLLLLLLQYKYSGGDFGKQYDPLGKCNEESPHPEDVDNAVLYYGGFKDVFGERAMNFADKNRETLTNEVVSVGNRESLTLLWRYSFSGVGERTEKSRAGIDAADRVYVWP